MKYLLDTHTLIWLIEASPKVPLKVKEELSDHSIFLSSVSLWEIAIKITLGKLKLQISFDELLTELSSTNIQLLHIKNEYLTQLLHLPAIHRDPFDRLLVSTALAEGLTLVSADENIHQYPVAWIW